MAFLICASLSRQLHRDSPNNCPSRHAPIWLARILSSIDTDVVQVSRGYTRLHANPHPRASLLCFYSPRKRTARSHPAFSFRMKFARRELLCVPGKSSLDQFVRRSRISRKVPITARAAIVSETSRSEGGRHRILNSGSARRSDHIWRRPSRLRSASGNAQFP